MADKTESQIEDPIELFHPAHDATIARILERARKAEMREAEKGARHQNCTI